MAVTISQGKANNIDIGHTAISYSEPLGVIFNITTVVSRPPRFLFLSRTFALFYPRQRLVGMSIGFPE